MTETKTPRTDAQHELNATRNVSDEYGAMLDLARQLELELTALTKERDALLKDKERLDWLDLSTNGFRNTVVLVHNCAHYQNVRSAIDDAMTNANEKTS